VKGKISISVLVELDTRGSEKLCWLANTTGSIHVVEWESQWLSYWDHHNTTVVSDNGACIDVVCCCGQKEMVACNCGKLDTTVDER